MTWAALVVLGWLALLQLGQPPRDTMFWNTLFDAGHALGFLIAASAIDRILKGRMPRLAPRRRVLSAAVLCCALGVATEIVQFADARRHPSVDDFLRDVAGIVAFLALWHLQAGGVRKTAARAALMATTVAACAFALAPWLLVASAYRQRNAAFPVLVAFEPWEKTFLTIDRATASPALDRDPAATLLSLAPGLYSGFYVDEPYPDWRAFDRLEFDIELRASRPLALFLRVHDDRHTGADFDRFNRTIRLDPGRQHVSIPLAEIAAGPSERQLDLSAVRGLAIFAHSLSTPVEVVLTPLRLRPKT